MAAVPAIPAASPTTTRRVNETSPTAVTDSTLTGRGIESNGWWATGESRSCGWRFSQMAGCHALYARRRLRPHRWGGPEGAGRGERETFDLDIVA